MTSADLSIITLVMNASIVVKCVMGILLIASLSSWATIFSKMLVLSRSRRQTDDFEKRFWSGLDLAKLYETASTRPERIGAQERMFVAGMNEFLKMPDRPADDVLSGVRRSMNATFQREMDALERGLPMLASIGSVSPISVCSAPSGASWMLSPVCQALKTCLWPSLLPALPKHSLPPPWAFCRHSGNGCLQPLCQPH